MSTQSILTKDLYNYQQEFENKLLDLGENYIIYKKFLVGNKMDFNKMMFVKSFHNLLCTDNCELIHYISKKIEGKLKECSITHKNKLSISELIKLHEKEIKKCDITEILSNCVGKIKW